MYIKNFPNDWDEDKIKAEFGKSGKVQALVCWLSHRGHQGPIGSFP